MTLKRASRSAAANGEHHGGDPAGRFQIVQTPEIEDQRRRDAEIDEVGQAVELGAEARGSLEEPRQAAVDTVEDRREHDGREREHIAVLERHADRGQAGAQRQERHQFGASVRTGMRRNRRRRGSP